MKELFFYMLAAEAMLVNAFILVVFLNGFLTKPSDYEDYKKYRQDKINKN